MRQAVLIATWSGGAEPLAGLLASLQGSIWPLVIVVNDAPHADPAWLGSLPGTVLPSERDGYELGAFALLLGQTEVEEFVFLQDSFEVKDQAVFDVAFGHYGSVAFGPQFHHYAGKWRRAPLEALGIPVVSDKEDSIREETEFVRRYRAIEPTLILDPDFDDAHGHVEERFGRLNLRLENRYLRKWKGTWR